MAYVVTEACIKCKYTDCADVCPVTCFYEGENMLVINPSECIDCCACESECPVHAIYADHDVPANQTPYIEINAVLSGAKAPDDADTNGWPEQLTAAVKSGSFTAWPNIPKKKDALPEADEFAKVENKGPMLSPNPGAGG